MFLHLCGPATVLSRKFLLDLTTVRHFKIFLICIIRIFTTKIENFRLRSNNLVCAGAFQLLRSRAPAQLRGSIACGHLLVLVAISKYSMHGYGSFKNSCTVLIQQIVQSIINKQ
jgi:hypothetical protein